MTWLWHQFQDFALGIAAVFWIGVLLHLAIWSWRAPRQLGAVLCGELALLCAIVGLLWAAPRRQVAAV